jgi:hypothetical protein
MAALSHRDFATAAYINKSLFYLLWLNNVPETKRLVAISNIDGSG